MPGTGRADQVRPVDERDRHPGPVVGGGPAALGAVAGGVEVPQDGLALAERQLARVEVEVVGRPRGGERRVPVAEHGGVVLGIGLAPHRRRRLGLGHRGGGAGGVLDDAHPGLAVLALVDGEVADERVDGVEAHPGAGRDDLGPPVAAGCLVGRLHQAEVLGAVVGDDEEAARAPARRVAAVVVDRVLDALATWLDDGEGALGIVGVQDPDLGGDLGVEAAQHVAVVLRAPHAEVEVVVGLLDDQHVAGRVGPDPVTPQLEGTHGLVDPDVEDGGVVVGPCDAVGGVLDGLVRLRAGHQVAEPHRVALASGGVGRVHEPAVVGTDREVAEGEVVVALGEGVLVEEHLLDVLGARRPAGGSGCRSCSPPGSGRSRARGPCAPGPTGPSPRCGPPSRRTAPPGVPSYRP